MKLQNFKPRLIILSDLWGKEKSFWIDVYLKLLETKFHLKYYDCCELAEINKTQYIQDDLHQQFLNGGIDKAVENLKAIEKEEVYVLAFSIGGVIAWKASLTGLKSKGIFAISATRLRFETEKPSGTIVLIYGEKDQFKPENNWFEKFKLKKILSENESHNFYENPEMGKKLASLVCKNLLK